MDKEISAALAGQTLKVKTVAARITTAITTAQVFTQSAYGKRAAGDF